jgi:hypothetical protein
MQMCAHIRSGRAQLFIVEVERIAEKSCKDLDV